MMVKFEDEQTAISRTLATLGLPINDKELALHISEAHITGNSHWQICRDVPEGKVLYTAALSARPDLKLSGFTATIYWTNFFRDMEALEELRLSSLLQKLCSIDWMHGASDDKATELFYQHKYILEGNNKTKAIIAAAMFAHSWAGTYYQRYIEQLPQLSQISDSIFFPVNNNVNDFTSGQAYNLLAGRAVLKFQDLVTDRSSFQGVWKELQDGKLVDIPSFGIDDILEKYEVKEYRDETKGPRLIYDLLNGDRVPCHIPGPEGDREMFIAADPSQSDLKLYQPGGTRLVIVKMEKEDERARKREVQQWKRKPGKRL